MFEISEDTVDDPELCWAYVFFKQNLTMATAMFALQLQQLQQPAVPPKKKMELPLNDV